MSERGLPQLARRFNNLYTGAIADVLDKRGYLSQTLPHDIVPLAPGTRMAGPAWPTLGRPHPNHDYDSSIRRILEMLGAVPAYHVVVHQTNDHSSAHLGELSVTSLQSRGCAGAVIAGGCRDVEFILRSDFPVFCRYTTPQDCVPRWELLEYDVPVVVGGVGVNPGDYIVADRDAVVVVPSEIRDDVLAEAESVVSTENDIRAAVREGMLPLEAYERYGIF
jgi:4-hydroxy-4-methyl-2-oxoglutarate aldolase